MKKCKINFSFLKSFDVFGVPIQLTFNERNYYQSYFGAVISSIVRGLVLYFFISQILSWVNIENSTTITSKENYTVQSFLKANRSVEYIWDSSNYNVYFALIGYLSNGEILSYRELSKYFSLEYYYSSDGYDSYEKIESEPCNMRKSYDFLLNDYDREHTSENEINNYTTCVKNPLIMGLRKDPNMKVILRPVLSFQIRKCKNGSAIICASEDEIKEMIKYVSVQVSIPQTIYDFTNKTSPIKRLYNFEFYYLDWNLKKNIGYEINPTYLYKDQGIFSDDFKFDSINFNPGYKTIDINSKDDSDVLFGYEFSVSFQSDIYYIRNEKFNNLLGRFGGWINIIFKIGSFLCSYFNNFFFTKALINACFKFRQDSQFLQEK